jgi:uroporphyrinogen-III synthase
MSHGDVRSTRIAIVPDAVLAGLLDDLEEAGWAVMQLPPAEIDADVARLWVGQTAEQAAEFLRNDYTVVLAGETEWADELDRALADLGAPALTRIEATAEALRQYAIQPPSTSRLTPET